MNQLPKRLIEIPEMRRIKHIHFVGIGGAGMCGIAEVMFNQGYQVSGSDINQSAVTKRLVALGINVYMGHEPAHIEGASVIVVSTAIDQSNPEVAAAIQAHVPVVRRADMLGEIMRYRHSIAVAGAHGKTTTTSMLTCMLEADGLNPTFVIGGKLNMTGTNARLGASRYMVAEADESDASFLMLRPMAVIITNIDEDHMETYGNSFDRLKAAYLQFVHNMPFYGLCVVSGDDEELVGLMPQIARPVRTFGLREGCDVRGQNVHFEGLGSSFHVTAPGKVEFDVTLKVPGMHNVQNALASIAMALDEGVSVASIQSALAEFAGVGRRFEILGEFDHPAGGAPVTLVDDYGHHPAEVQVTIDAARKAYPDRRLCVLFQPHRYSRTRDCFDDFVEVLSEVDTLFLLDVYSAGEAPVEGADSKALARSIRNRGKVDPTLVQPEGNLADVLTRTLKPGDVLIAQGAGSVGALAQKLVSDQLYLGGAA